MEANQDATGIWSNLFDSSEVMEANQDTTYIWSNLSDKSELVFNLLKQEEIFESNLRDLFNEEADGEDNISNDGGVQYSAHDELPNGAPPPQQFGRYD